MTTDVRSEPGLIRVPGWEQFSWLRAAFSTRSGGLSEAYGPAEQNLGWTREDDPRIVAENRRRFAEAATGATGWPLITVQQVHGAEVRDLDRETGPFMTEEGKARLCGDGLMTATAGRLLGVLTADCVPVLVADTRSRAVAGFHAGWRGTVARIVQQGVEAMGRNYGCRPEDLIAAIGPCIRGCCFEVGDEVRRAFAEAFPYGQELVREAGPSEGSRAHIDLVEANRRQLADAGVPEAAIRVVGGCTACERTQDGRRRFFSHRAEAGVTGRMLAVIGLLPEQR